MSTVSRGFKGRRRLMRRAAPGQYLVEDFPVLSAGPTPSIELEDWELTITSETDEQRRWDWAGFRPCPASRSPSTSTASPTGPSFTTWEGCRWTPCSTAWTPAPASRWSPPTLQHQPAAGGPDRPQGLDRLPLRRPGAGARAWWAGPAGPHLYLWKSAKWVRGIQLLDQDEPGFWESPRLSQLWRPLAGAAVLGRLRRGRWRKDYAGYVE